MSTERTVTAVDRRPVAQPAAARAEAPAADGFAALLQAAAPARDARTERPVGREARAGRDDASAAERGPRRGDGRSRRTEAAEQPTGRPAAAAPEIPVTVPAPDAPQAPAATPAESATTTPVPTPAESATTTPVPTPAESATTTPVPTPVPTAAGPLPLADPSLVAAADAVPTRAVAAPLGPPLPPPPGAPLPVPSAAVAPVGPTQPVAPAPVAPDAAQGAAVPVDPMAVPADPQADVPVPAPNADTATPADVPAPVTAELPADAPRLPDAPADPSPSQTATPDPAPQPGVQADAGRSGDERPAGDSSSSTAAAAPATEAPAAPPAASPIAPSVQAVLPGTQRTAALHQAPRAVAQLIHVAGRDGIDRARINLRPADLGGIEIRLQHSAAGVTAHVIAESPEAARLLDQAAGDLRRALERQDVTLLSLDVSTSQDRRAGGSDGSAFDLGGDRDGRHQGGRHAGGRAEPEAEAVVSHTVRLPDGLLVDVLA